MPFGFFPSPLPLPGLDEPGAGRGYPLLLDARLSEERLGQVM
jgi:hypothetical protein